MSSIYTIGHSTRPIDEFIGLLRRHQIEVLADVRHYPGSRRYPQFNKEALSATMAAAHIDYVHLPDLGGRRRPKPDSPNTAWRSEQFRGYADYMETPEFHRAIGQLTGLARDHRTAFMCAEAVWWKCHRSLISDYLKATGWTVVHILTAESTREHPYTPAARIVGGALTYRPE